MKQNTIFYRFLVLIASTLLVITGISALLISLIFWLFVGEKAFSIIFERYINLAVRFLEKYLPFDE